MSIFACILVLAAVVAWFSWPGDERAPFRDDKEASLRSLREDEPDRPDVGHAQPVRRASPLSIADHAVDPNVAPEGWDEKGDTGRADPVATSLCDNLAELRELNEQMDRILDKSEATLDERLREHMVETQARMLKNQAELVEMTKQLGMSCEPPAP